MAMSLAVRIRRTLNQKDSAATILICRQVGAAAGTNVSLRFGRALELRPLADTAGRTALPVAWPPLKAFLNTDQGAQLHGASAATVRPRMSRFLAEDARHPPTAHAVLHAARVPLMAPRR